MPEESFHHESNEHHVFLHFDKDVVGLLRKIATNQRSIMAALDALTASVAQTLTVEESAKTLIEGLSAQLATAIAALPDPAALTDLQNQLDTEAASLASAVAANTPAAP